MEDSESPRTASDGRVGTLAAAGSLLAAVLTALPCTAPMLAILLGASGFGYLARYAWLRGPATGVTVVLLLTGFYLTQGAPRCVRAPRLILWLATVVAVAINVFEYLVFPTLA